MEDFILVGYSKSENKFHVLSSGSLEELLKIRSAFSDITDYKMKAVEFPKGKTLEDIISDTTFLEKEYGYIKDLDDSIYEKESHIDYSDIGDNELF